MSIGTKTGPGANQLRDNGQTLSNELYTIFRRLRRHRPAILGGAVFVLLLLAALLAPWISPYPPNEPNYAAALKAPSPEHLLGADELGRDVLSRIIYGARVSLQVGLISVGIALTLGLLLGATAGYYGGRLDDLIMRIMDILLAFPGVLLAIAIMAVLGPGIRNAMIAIGIVSIPQYARIVRGSVLSLKENEYIEAARALGTSTGRLVGRHILPNILAPLIVRATLGTSEAILEAAALGFLGLGVQPPTAEWGAMLSGGRNYLYNAPHIATFPGVAITITVLAMNLFGDGLRDALDPRLKL
ncbi:MAG: ABC transporter permease [Firmicutes bacterium]|nr:ABC transporter permease [Bacillota bacterium]MCL5040254.1 ABC transporter permease [Bacillota bacterium]